MSKTNSKYAERFVYVLDLRSVHTEDNNYKVNDEDIALNTSSTVSMKCARLCFYLELVARRPVSESPRWGKDTCQRAAPPYSREWQQIYKRFV